MTSQEARNILRLYRPGTSDAQDPEVRAALQVAAIDPELRQWLDQHRAFHSAIASKFREIPTPAHLREALLAERAAVSERKMVRLSWWQQPLWLTAAAVFLCAGLVAYWLVPTVPDRFADYRARMVRMALRQYSMDIVTNDMNQVRHFMAQRGGPSDYVLPDGLQRLSLTGGGFLRWRSAPVSMICFDRGDRKMLYLFVLKRGSVRGAPPPAPQSAKINKLMTLSWSRGDNTYVLAGPEEPNFARKYQ